MAITESIKQVKNEESEPKERIAHPFRSLSELVDYVSGKSLPAGGVEEAGLAEPVPFPFLAIVGQREMKLALLLSLVNPSVGGVLLIGPRGTAKTTAVRSLLDLLPNVEPQPSGVRVTFRERMGWDAQDRETTWLETPYRVAPFWNNEDWAPSPLHFALLALASLSWPLFPKGYRLRAAIYAAMLLAMFFTFSIILRWQMWHCRLLLPMMVAGTPNEIVAKINSQVNSIMAMPDMRSRIVEQGFMPVTMDVGETEKFFVKALETAKDIPCPLDAKRK